MGQIHFSVHNCFFSYVYTTQLLSFTNLESKIVLWKYLLRQQDTSMPLHSLPPVPT